MPTEVINDIYSQMGAGVLLEHHILVGGRTVPGGQEVRLLRTDFQAQGQSVACVGGAHADNRFCKVGRVAGSVVNLNGQ